MSEPQNSQSLIFKKCIPNSLLGSFNDEAISVIERDEVFVASIASLPAICSSSLNRAFFISIFSTTASIIRWQSFASFLSVVFLIFKSILSFLF